MADNSSVLKTTTKISQLVRATPRRIEDGQTKHASAASIVHSLIYYVTVSGMPQSSSSSSGGCAHLVARGLDHLLLPQRDERCKQLLVLQEARKHRKNRGKEARVVRVALRRVQPRAQDLSVRDNEAGEAGLDEEHGRQQAENTPRS